LLIIKCNKIIDTLNNLSIANYFFSLDRNLELTLDAKLGYSNYGDKDGDWKLYATSVEKRNLDCVPDEVIVLYCVVLMMSTVFHNLYLKNMFCFRKWMVIITNVS